MKTLHSLWNPVKTFFKGMFALFTVNLLIVGCLFIFDSCKKADYLDSYNGKARDKFLSALQLNKNTIGAISFTKYKIKSPLSGSATSSTQQIAYPETTGSESIYLQYPANTTDATRNLTFSTTSIQQLSDLVGNTNAIVQYDPTSSNANYKLEISVQNVVNSLRPMIEESKQYLYTKGFTAQDINNMLIEQGGKEEDLIPFVMSLTRAENSQPVARNYSNFFINSAYARIDANDYIRCAIIGIGADVIWSLTMSNSSSWSVGAMKKAFGAVAKRMLGPIGVAIAVASFGICMAEAYYS